MEPAQKDLGDHKGAVQNPSGKGFVDDLIVYLDYKIREGERIRTERKQLSFW